MKKKTIWKIFGSILLAGVVIAGVIAVAPLVPQLTTGAIGLYNGIQEAWVDDDFTPDTSGWGITHFNKIQDGIDAVVGSIVYVAAGTYNENVVVDKRVILIGEGKDVVTVNATTPFDNNVFYVTASNVSITGFTASGGYGTTFRAGIWLENVDNCSILNNNLTDNSAGIRLEYSEFNIIENNQMTLNKTGIYVYCSDNNIVNNNESSSNELGMILFDSLYNDITNNTVTLNEKGIYLQGTVAGLGSSVNDILYNTISMNDGFGISIDADCHENILTNNTIESNDKGIIFNSNHGNLVVHNNLINNTINAEDSNPSINAWHNDSTQEGNYWSDYTGIDDGSGSGKHSFAGDGIGDTLIPHPVTDFDNYPFTSQNGWQAISTISQPEVEISDNTISEFTDYIIQFQVSEAVPTSGTITIEFPAGTDINIAADADVHIQTTAGFGAAQLADVGTDSVWDADENTVTITLIDLTAVPTGIGEYAMVTVEILSNSVENPAIPGDYTLFAETSEQPTAIESAPYTIQPPILFGEPGIIVYNPAGYGMAITSGDEAMMEALSIAREDWTLHIYPGTYNGEGLDYFAVTQDDLTVEAIGSAGDIIWMDGSSVVFDGINEDPAVSDGDGILKDVTITGITFVGGGIAVDEVSDLLIQNCVFEKSTTAPETLLALGETDGSNIINCDFDTTYDVQNDTCIHVMDADWTITDCDFLLDEADIDIYTDY